MSHLDANVRGGPLVARPTSSVVFVLPPGGVTPHFAEHLGTAYLRTMLLAAGIASEPYLPPRNPGLREFSRFLRERRPALVGLTAYESNLRTCRALVRAVREALPDAVVAVGGPNATFSPDETLELLGADVCVRGAGEGTIAGIVEGILGADSARGRLPDLLAAFPNLAVRTADGVHHTAAGELSSFPADHFRCLDDLPSPYQACVVATPDVGILTARGCNQRCTYCSFAAISGHRVHFHGVERVLDDLAALKALAGRVERQRPTIAIADDAFTLAPERARAICEGIVRRGLELPFECETRADRVDAGLLGLMKRAGFTRVSFGLESAVPRVLRAIGKVQDPDAASDPGFEAERHFLERLRRAVADAKGAGLGASVSVIGGLPGESADDFRATLAFVATLGVPYAHNVLSILPGTPLHRDRERYGLRAGREEASGSWRTEHAYDVRSVRPAPRSSVHRVLWDEANELADAICGRPRTSRASDGAAWAAVLHGAEPDGAVAAWLREVLAVSGAVVVAGGSRGDRTSWLRALEAAGVAWGTLAVLRGAEAPCGEASSTSFSSLGTAGEHRFDVRHGWHGGGGAIATDGAGACRVPLWFAADGDPPPPSEGLSTVPPQIVDSCRWWSGFRRCRDPRTLHVWPGGRVTPCWRGPAIGRVGDAYGALAARGLALERAALETGAPSGRCPLGAQDEVEPQTSSAAETWEVAAQMAWLFRETPAPRPSPGRRSHGKGEEAGEVGSEEAAGQ